METFHQHLHQRARELPDKTAFLFVERDDRERSLTFAALHQQASQVAALLAAATAVGDRVLLLFPPCLEYVPAFYGAMLAGTISVTAYPPDPRLGPAGMASLLAIAADAGPAAVLAPRAICQALAGKVPTPLLSFEDALEQVPTAAALRAPAEDGIAYLQYTSGSTGSAKGVAITHANLLAHCAQFVEGFGISREDRTVLWLPVHHSFGMFAGVIVPVFLGQTSVQMSPLAFLEKPSRWLTAMSRFAGTVSGGPNFAFDLVAKATPPGELAALDLRRWRVAGLGGEPVRAETLRRFAAATAPAGFDPRALHPSLGISEATLAASANPEFREPTVLELDAEALEHGRVALAGPDTARQRSLVGLGRPLRGQHLQIAAEPGMDVGEVWTSGANVAAGYWRRPEDSARVFGGTPPGTPATSARSLRTGDLGFLYRGELFLVGRAKDLIIVRGCNYHPHDLEQSAEAALSAPPQSVAAFSIDGAEGEELVLALELDGTSDRLAAACASARAAISQHHNLRCHAVVCVPRGGLPRTGSAKLQRGECRRRYLAGELPVAHAELSRETAPHAPARPTSLREAVAQVLRRPVDKVDAAATLSELGLDSMATVELHELALDALGLELPYERLLDPSTRLAELEAAPSLTLDARPTCERVGLPQDLVPTWSPRDPRLTQAPAKVLLTGATGYLGAHLVGELLRQTSAQLVCLVRAASHVQAQARVEEAVVKHVRELPEGWRSRVRGLPGDFTAAQLGQREETFAALATEVDTVVHCGAWVNFLYPYRVLEAANVHGLEQVLRLVAQGRPKVLHHLSTVAVLFSPGYERGRCYPEQHPLASDGELPNGYEQTKWVADKHLELARARGFCISNHRVGYVTGAATDGHDFRLDEFFPSAIKACIQLGIAPALDTRLPVVPIDYAAAAIARIVTQPHTAGATYHIHHPRPPHLRELLAWMNARGYQVTAVPFPHWRQQVQALGQARENAPGHDNALRPYAGFVRRLQEEQTWLPELDGAQTRAAVAPLRCPEVDELLEVYFRMFERTGYLPAARR